MERDRLRTALARIDSAFARLEAAADRPRASAPATILVEQNMHLRETIGETLSEIDRLIERLER